VRFGEVDIVLDTPQRFVIDYMLVSQTDDRLSFNSQRFVL
jgi:hypothetical protein